MSARPRWWCACGADRPGAVRLIESFGTTVPDLLALHDWLAGLGVTHVAMESTGVYWKSPYYLLEDDFEVLLVNAAHVKHVPGRKTDTIDAAWLALLLSRGLLRPSFVPPPPIRELRDLTRYRKALINEKSREVNRIHKTLEDAGVKLSSVATDVMGVSGRDMIRALIAARPTRLLPAAERADVGAIDDAGVVGVSRPRRRLPDGAWSAGWRGGRQGGAAVMITRW